VRLDLQLGRGDLTTICDPNQLESTLLNLAINARDAMPDGGVLTIGIAETHLAAADITDPEIAPGDFIEISVTDTGQGMPPDVLARVFEPFFTTKPIGHGTGLGLSQVYGFMRQSGGIVRIDSTYGEGTTVRLLLPLVKTEREACVPSDGDLNGLRQDRSAPPHRTIVVVDDEREVREQVSAALRETGFSVVEAVDGAAGLKLFQSGKGYDLLVTDVGMPGLNGRQLADAARILLPNLPILMITGYAGKETDQLQHLVNVEIMRKPFSLDALVNRVGSMLSSY
jgi:CheY-like chemotaxis protein